MTAGSSILYVRGCVFPMKFKREVISMDTIESEEGQMLRKDLILLHHLDWRGKF